MSGKKIKLICIGIIAVIAIFGVIKTVGVVKVEGNEVYVRQNMFQGVLDDVYRDGTHWYFGWIQDVYKYDIGTQKCTFDSATINTDADYPSIEVNVGENGGQSAWIPMSINYRIGWDAAKDENGVPTPRFNPKKLISLHKDGLRTSYEDVVIKRTVVEVVNRIARPKQALEIYSGKGYNEFVADIEEALTEHPVFKSRGILVENVIVYTVKLNPEYEKEIENKQLAEQKKLREIEETKAAQEKAKRVFADSQAEVEKTKQIAEGEKIKRVKRAEAEKAETVLRAEAEKEKRIAEAEGERDANLALASGVLAVGTAEAQVDALKREALYGGEAGARRANVEIAIAQADKLAGIFKGVSIVPEKTILSVGNSGLVVNPSQE